MIKMMTFEELLDAWRVNNAINLEMLERTSEEDLGFKPGRGKTIRANLVHLIDIRAAHVEERLKEDAERIPRLDWRRATKDELREGLIASHDAMAKLFRLREESPSRKPDRWTTPMFFAYCIAHEAHHRAQIEMSWRLADREPEDVFLFRMWDWHKK
jgi:uncharacterized damage-inducible protein DinB